MPVAFHGLMRLVRPHLAEPDRSLVERFVTADDQAAFTALVERHGPMVLGVCRRVLRDAHRADDAFQATFLVLARKAGQLRVDGSLSSWLFGVARRVALAARRADERHNRLRHLKPLAASQVNSADWDDLLQLLDAELARLPEKYRAPLLACYLDGRTQDEAARELGWSLSTLRRRLEHGRELLRVRLTARGAALSAGLFAGALAPTARAAVPDNLRQMTVSIAARRATVPELIGRLANEGIGMSSFTRWGIAAAVVTAACGLAIGIAATPQSPPKENPAPAKPPALGVTRDRFNDPLPPKAIARMGTVGFRHRGAIDGLAYSRNGEQIVSIGFGSVSFWDAKSGHERAVVQRTAADNEILASAKLMPDGASLVIYPGIPLRPPNSAPGTFVNGQPYIWDVEGKRELRKLTVGAHNPQGMSEPRLFAPDGSAMAGGQPNGDVYLWDGNGKPTHILKDAVAKSAPADAGAGFALGGKALVTIDGSHLIRVWDTQSGKVIRSMGGDLAKSAALAVSPDGKQLVTVAMDDVPGSALAGAARPEKVRIWDLAAGKLVREIVWGNESSATHRLFPTFSSDGNSVIVVDYHWYAADHIEMRRWRVSDGELVRRWTVSEPNLGLGAVAFDPAGKTVAFGMQNGVVRLFDLESGKETTPTAQHTGSINSIAFSTDRNDLWTTAADGTVRAWEIASGRMQRSVRTEDGRARLNTTGDKLIEQRRVGFEVVFRDFPSGEVCGEVKSTAVYVPSPDGKSIWSVGRDDRLAQWDLATGANQRSIPVKSVVRPIAVTDGGRHLVLPIAVTNGGKLVVVADERQTRDRGAISVERRIRGIEAATKTQTFGWSFADEQPSKTGFHDLLRYSAVSADGRFIAMIMEMQIGPDRQHRVSVRELPTGKVIWKPADPDTFGNELAFRPDGNVLATGGDVVKLFDATTGKKLGELGGGHRGAISNLTFSADGKRLASGGRDGIVMVWDVGDVAP